jgi:hypothetical protein
VPLPERGVRRALAVGHRSGEIEMRCVCSLSLVVALAPAATWPHNAVAQGASEPTPEAAADEGARAGADLEAARRRLEQAIRDIGRARARLFEVEDRPLADAEAWLGLRISLGGEGAGVLVGAVLPGGPAEAVGLLLGDLLTRAGDTSLAAGVHAAPGESADPADADRASLLRLLDYLATREPGDTVVLEYVREAVAAQTELSLPARDGVASDLPLPPEPGVARGPILGPGYREWFAANDVPARFWRIESRLLGGALPGLDLAPVRPGFSHIFGAAEGLLVIRVEPDTLDLREGDVILRIGGRTPVRPRHALRILGSYARGEAVTLEIVRDDALLTLHTSREERDR